MIVQGHAADGWHEEEFLIAQIYVLIDTEALLKFLFSVFIS